MDPNVAGTLVYKIATTALQLKAVAEGNEIDKREVSCLLGRLRDVSFLVHSALQEVYSNNSEALSAAVQCTLERIVQALADTRDVAYRHFVCADLSCPSSAFSRGIDGGATAPAVAYCHTQLSQAMHELQSYVHICVSMEADRLSQGGQSCRMQVQLPDMTNNRLTDLHNLATAPCMCSDQRVVCRLARLVLGKPAEQLDALVKLSHMANESSFNCDLIAAAGAIPFLVELLGSSNMDALELAAGVLGTMAYLSSANQAAIAAAGGIDRLMKLLGMNHPAVLCLQGKVQHHADSPIEQAAIHDLEVCLQQFHC